MLALRDLLITGGLGMILVAVGILGYDLYRELLYRRAHGCTGGGHGAGASAMALAHFGGVGAAGVGTDSAGVRDCGGAERHGGSACQRNERDASRARCIPACIL